MPRKWTTLAAAVAAVILTASGFSYADEDSPVHKLMEKVGAKNNAVAKGVRTPVAFKKAQKELDAHVEELIKLGKEWRELKEPAEKQKKSFAEWTKLTDDYIKKSEALKEAIGKGQAEAKSAHNAVKATCTACHEVFRVEE